MVDNSPLADIPLEQELAQRRVPWLDGGGNRLYLVSVTDERLVVLSDKRWTFSESVFVCVGRLGAFNIFQISQMFSTALGIYLKRTFF